MKFFVRLSKAGAIFGAATLATLLAIGAAGAPSSQTAKTDAESVVELSETQVKSMQIEPAGEHVFPQEKHAVGTIDFNQELLTQVFTPYQGRVIRAYASVGERVMKDQILFTIDSPDLLQAESTLITSAGVLELTTKNLERQRNLVRQSASALKDYEQTVSDQQAAEGSYRAARAAVRVFGKSDVDIDRIVADRKIDPALIVPSPISGLITARNAAPGLLVQAGNPPPVYTVADTSTMWMLANVPERDISDLRVGQEVKASVATYPGHSYQGKIVTIGASVDPNTRRVLVRSEIADPNYDLRAGMFANFSITIAPPKRAVAVPAGGLVREGDGTMTVWIAADHRKFFKRVIKTGLVNEGFTEVTDGLKLGELIVTDGSLFIANQFTNAAK